MNLAQYIPKNLSFQIGGLGFSPSWGYVAAIVFLIFLLVLTLAQVRRHFLEWAFKGVIPGIFLGFLLALLLEGFLVIGGKTALTEVLGWKNPPKPLSNLLDAGRGKLTEVLGASSKIPLSSADEKTSVEKVIQSFQSLNPRDSQKARSLICTP